MSLTSLIKGKTETDKKVQTILRNAIPKKSEFSSMSEHQAFSQHVPIQVPYELSISYHASVVGTAFDYMARLLIARLKKDLMEDELVARRGLDIILKYEKFHPAGKKLTARVEKKYKQAIRQINQFTKKEKVDVKEVVPHACFLSRLEHIFRSGLPPMDIQKSLLNEELEEITEDVYKLCKVFEEVFIRTNVITKDSDVVYNPHFGKVSMGCGGADADVYIDGTLYDFKSTKAKGYKWQDIAQIYGYFLLDCIAYDMNDKSASLYGRDIKRIAIYKARYGEIEYVDTATLSKEKLYDAKEALIRVLKPNLMHVDFHMKMNQKTRRRTERSDENDMEANRNSFLAQFCLIAFFIFIGVLFIIFIV